LLQRPLIREQLAFRHPRALPDSHVRPEQVRPPGDGEHANDAAPRVAHEGNPPSVEAPYQVRRQVDDVIHELCHVQSGAVAPRIERLAGQPLIPVHDDEGPFQGRRVAPHQRQLGRAWAAVHEQRDGIGDVLGANQHPLPRRIDRHALQQGDGVGVAPAVESRCESRHGQQGEQRRREHQGDQQRQHAVEGSIAVGVTRSAMRAGGQGEFIWSRPGGQVGRGPGGLFLPGG
jgi:hypothetical protein